jgi:hypothetical protein
MTTTAATSPREVEIGDLVSVLGRGGDWLVIDADHDRRRMLVVPRYDCWCPDPRMVDFSAIIPTEPRH